MTDPAPLTPFSRGSLTLRVERPETSGAFRALLEAIAPLPWTADEAGVVADATGRTVCIVDVWRDLPDDTAARVAFCIMLAANTCGGFLAVPAPRPGGAA